MPATSLQQAAESYAHLTSEMMVLCLEGAWEAWLVLEEQRGDIFQQLQHLMQTSPMQEPIRAILKEALAQNDAMQVMVAARHEVLAGEISNTRQQQKISSTYR